MRFLKLCDKIDFNQWALSRFHAIEVAKNWDLSDLDPKWIGNSGSDRIRLWIHSTGYRYLHPIY